ncbi:MAG: hypothetical protein A2X96_08825 [Syntrophobacterales bacterium GWC2_56_13]|nr:MAG: hypothetical protein A2X96_08825 [Syntrophobacterales bacterium GWC2_56_13]
MAYRLFAYLVMIVHGMFVLFVALGGLLVLSKRRWAWLHVPALFWGAWIEFSGGICPLTPLENWLSDRGGLTVYRGDFLDRYLMPLLYPDDLTQEFQIILGVSVILINAGLYAFLWYRIRREGNPG